MSITKEKTKHIDELHFEHQLWIKELQFYKDELVVFNKRLTEVAGMYTNNEVLNRLEHFQNQFILQNEVADTLLHDLKEHEHILANTAKEFSIAIDHRAFSDHPKMREAMDSFIKIYRELRNDYMRFLSEVM
jgi:hypothetical protein